MQEWCGFRAFFCTHNGDQWVTIGFSRGNKLVTSRRRVNLSFSEADYQRLVAVAQAEGKTPSTMAADLVKVAILGARGVRGAQAVSRASGGAVRSSEALEASQGLSRQRKRALERAKAKSQGRR